MDNAIDNRRTCGKQMLDSKTLKITDHNRLIDALTKLNKQKMQVQCTRTVPCNNSFIVCHIVCDQVILQCHSVKKIFFLQQLLVWYSVKKC